MYNPQVIFSGTTAQFSGTDPTQIVVSATNKTLQLLILNSGSGGITLSSGTGANIGAITSTGTYGESYAYLNGGQIGNGVDPAAFGAHGDGVQDDGTALNNAEMYCRSSGRPLTLRPGTTYIINEPLIWYNPYSSIIGNGATLRTGTYASSVGIVVSNTTDVLDSGSASAVINVNRYEINGLNLQGPGRSGTDPTTYTRSSIGIVMGDNADVSSTDSAANVMIRNCSIHSFDVDVSWEHQSNSYLQKFENDQFGSCNWCLYADTLPPVGTTGTALNVGENIRFSQCVFYGCQYGVYANHGYNFNFDQCSFDYFNYYGLFADNGCAFNLNQCHIETKYDGDSWLRAETDTVFSDGPAMITFDQGILLNTNPNLQTHYLMETNSNNQYGSIKMERSNVVFSGDNNNETIGTGNVFVRDTANAAYPYFAFGGSAADNLLQDGGFEHTPASLPEWTVTGSAGIMLDNSTYVSGSTSPFASGTTSLKFAPAAGTASSITYSGTIPPGVIPTISYFVKNSLDTSGSDAFEAYAYETGTANSSLQPATEWVIRYSGNTSINYTNWTPQTYRLLRWTPTGGILKVVFATSTAVSGSSANWIDNVLIETP